MDILQSEKLIKCSICKINIGEQGDEKAFGKRDKNGEVVEVICNNCHCKLVQQKYISTNPWKNFIETLK